MEEAAKGGGKFTLYRAVERKLGLSECTAWSHGGEGVMEITVWSHGREGVMEITVWSHGREGDYGNYCMELWERRGYGNYCMEPRERRKLWKLLHRAMGEKGLRRDHANTVVIIHGGIYLC